MHIHSEQNLALPAKLLRSAIAAYQHLKKEYEPKVTYWDLTLDTNDGVVHRPNHGLLHSSRVAAYMSAVILEFFREHADPKYKLFFEAYADPKRLEVMQNTGFMSVVGREDESGFGTAQTHYLRYRRASADAFEADCRDPESTLKLSDAEIVHYKNVVLEMGNPAVLEQQKEKMQNISNAFEHGYRILVENHPLTETQLQEKIAAGSIKPNTIIIAGEGSHAREVYVIASDNSIRTLKNIKLKTNDIFSTLTANNLTSQGTLILDDAQVSSLRNRLMFLFRENSIATDNFDVAYIPPNNPMDYYLLHMAHDLDLFRCFDADHMQEMMYGPLFKQFCNGYDLNTKQATPAVQDAIIEMVATAIELIKKTGDRLFCKLDDSNGEGRLIRDSDGNYNRDIFGPLSHDPQLVFYAINKHFLLKKLEHCATTSDAQPIRQQLAALEQAEAAYQQARKATAKQLQELKQSATQLENDVNKLEINGLTKKVFERNQPVYLDCQTKLALKINEIARAAQPLKIELKQCQERQRNLQTQNHGQENPLKQIENEKKAIEDIRAKLAKAQTLVTTINATQHALQAKLQAIAPQLEEWQSTSKKLHNEIPAIQKKQAESWKAREILFESKNAILKLNDAQIQLLEGKKKGGAKKAIGSVGDKMNHLLGHATGGKLFLDSPNKQIDEEIAKLSQETTAQLKANEQEGALLRIFLENSETLLSTKTATLSEVDKKIKVFEDEMRQMVAAVLGTPSVTTPHNNTLAAIVGTGFTGPIAAGYHTTTSATSSASSTMTTPTASSIPPGWT